MKKKISALLLIAFLSEIIMPCAAEAKAAYASGMNPIAPIVIVGVDSNTLYYFSDNQLPADDSKNFSARQGFTGEFPIGRVWFERSINRLREAGSRLIAIDFLFQTTPPLSLNDINLAKSVAVGPPPVVVAFEPLPRPAEYESGVSVKQMAFPNISASQVKALNAPALAMPYKELVKAGASAGSTHVHKDSNGVVSRGSLIIKSGRYVLPSFALMIFLKTIGATLKDVRYSSNPPALIVKDTSIPLSDNGSLKLSLPPQKTLFKRYSLYRLVHVPDEFKKNSLADHIKNIKEDFDGTIAIIGPMDASLGDQKTTPAGNGYPGVEIIAATVNQLLNIWAAKHGITKPQYDVNKKK